MGDDERVVPVDPDLVPRASDENPPVGSRRTRTRWGGRVRLDVVAVIAVGGMIGSTGRYLLAEAVPVAPGQFPWTTFWTNMTGSFMLGYLLVILIERFPPTRYLRPFVATGILGAYTTMSTFLVETAELIKDGHAGTGLLYGFSSLVFGVTLAYLGFIAARLTPPRPHDQPPTKEAL
jgi:CrcB protein